MEETAVNIINKIGMGEVASLDDITTEIYLIDFVVIPSKKILEYIEDNPDFTTFTGVTDTGQEKIIIFRRDNSHENSFHPPDNRWINEWKKRNKGTMLEYSFVRMPYD